MNSIVLTHAYFLSSDKKEQPIMMPYAPLGLLSLSAWLEKHGYEHEVYDTTFSDSVSFKKYLDDRLPAYLCVYVNLGTRSQAIALISDLRADSRYCHTKVILGGPDVTHHIEQYLKAGADVLVIGEGEQTLLELITAIQVSPAKSLERIHGLAFINGEGRIIQTPARQRFRNLDELPFPNRKKINFQFYLQAWRAFHGFTSLSLYTQRGCPYTCRWCSTPIYGQSYRRRSPGRTVDEMVEIHNTFHPDQLLFVDDVFTISIRWLEEFVSEIRSRKLFIPFECITRADRLGGGVIGLLKEAGCYRIWMGAESGSQRVLHFMDRRIDIEVAQKKIQEIRLAGLETGVFIMLGYPGETERDVYQTLSFLKKANPNRYTITLVYPIKGTPLYEETISTQSAPDWSKSSDRETDFKRTYPRRYYDFAIRWIVNSMTLYQLQLINSSFSQKAMWCRLKIGIALLFMAWFKRFR